MYIWKMIIIIEIKLRREIMKFWLLILTIIIIAQGKMITDLMDEIEAIKSWYPFCEILKIKIPEKDDFETHYE